MEALITDEFTSSVFKMTIFTVWMYWCITSLKKMGLLQGHHSGLQNVGADLTMECAKSEGFSSILLT